MEVLVIGAVLALLVHFGQEPLPPRTHESVVLLPGADGRVGTVIVTRGANRRVLNEPYATTRSYAGRETSFERVSPEKARSEFEETLAALPARPRSFVVFFGSGVDELVPESTGELQGVLDELRLRPQSDIFLIGHTDRVGSDESNDQLSLQRADRIRAEIVGLGIASERIRVAGRGEREPLVPTADGVEEPLNRRVEISVR